VKYVRSFDYLISSTNKLTLKSRWRTSNRSSAPSAFASTAYSTTASKKWKTPKSLSDSVFGDLDGLLEHVDTKFTLVNVVTKRAKQLNNGAPPLCDKVNPNKPVSTAFNEVRLGKIKYKRTREGMK
jgi:DNA-directed RNA polymerase subunit omega